MLAALLSIGLVVANVALGHEPCDRQGSPELTSKPLEQRFVFESVRVAAGSPLRYEVSLAPCGAPLCPVEVRLLHNSQVLDATRLDDCFVAEEPGRSSVDYSPFAGDPMAPDENIAVWGTGAEQDGMTLAVRPIDLAPGLRGVLVHVGGGWEHAWVRHFLFVASRGRLRLAWSPRWWGFDSWATVDLKDIDEDGFPEILYFIKAPNGVLVDEEYQVGYAQAAAYRWDARREEIEPRSLARAGVPLYAVIAGYAEIGSRAVEAQGDLWRSCDGQRDRCDGARHRCFEALPPYETDPDAFRQAEARCVSDEKCRASFLRARHFLPLKTDPFPQLERGRFMVAAFSWRREKAAEALDTLRACRPERGGYLAELHFVPMPGAWE